MKKTILIIVGLVVIAGAALFLSAGGALKFVIEAAGREALGVPVHVSGAKLSLKDKSVSLSGLTVANPEGFSSDPLLQAGGIAVVLNDVTDTLVSVKSVNVSDLKVRFEAAVGGTNFDALRKSMHAAPSSASDKTGSSKGRKLAIDTVTITGAELVPAVGAAKAVVPLPDIVLRDVGTGKAPATAAQVAAQVMNKILLTSSTAMLRAGIEGAAGQVMEQAKDAIKGIFSK